MISALFALTWGLPLCSMAWQDINNISALCWTEMGVYCWVGRCWLHGAWSGEVGNSISCLLPRNSSTQRISYLSLGWWTQLKWSGAWLLLKPTTSAVPLAFFQPPVNSISFSWTLYNMDIFRNPRKLLPNLRTEWTFLESWLSFKCSLHWAIVKNKNLLFKKKTKRNTSLNTH